MLRKVDSSFCNNFSFAASITTEPTTCVATNLNSTLVVAKCSNTTDSPWARAGCRYHSGGVNLSDI